MSNLGPGHAAGLEPSREARKHPALMVCCLYCDAFVSAHQSGIPDGSSGFPGSRKAYDPELGRLWEICSSCCRWNPVLLKLRWEVLEELEVRVRREGEVVLISAHLGLFRVGEEEVVRVGVPSLTEWGAWRYGTRIMAVRPRLNFLERVLGSLPPAPLEGYDPYGLTGPMGGVGGKHGPVEWLASPFLDHARPLTMGFTRISFARECPSCNSVMLLHPWDFSRVRFYITSDGVGVEADCANCEKRVPLELGAVRPALRMGLAILDGDWAARGVGERAGAALDVVGGARVFLQGLGEFGSLLGELDRVDRIGLGISLDLEAEAEALEAQWSGAEELASIMEGELTEVPGFKEFRTRVLREIM